MTTVPPIVAEVATLIALLPVWLRSVVMVMSVPKLNLAMMVTQMPVVLAMRIAAVWAGEPRAAIVRSVPSLKSAMTETKRTVTGVTILALDSMVTAGMVSTSVPRHVMTVMN